MAEFRLQRWISTPPILLSADVIPAELSVSLLAETLGASNELRRRMLVEVETNANVADEVARRQIVRYMQTANSTNNNELVTSVSAEEHDYIALNDKFVSGNNKTEKGKKRTVYAPQPERNSSPPAIISVELDEDEDVEWIWTHTADGKSVVTGYIITKRTEKPGQRMEVSDDLNRS